MAAGARRSPRRRGGLRERLRRNQRLRTLTVVLLPQIWEAVHHQIRVALAFPRLGIARLLVARENWSAVIRILAPHVRTDTVIVRSAQVVISALGKVGDFHAAYVLADRTARQSQRPVDMARADSLRGRILETHPAWLPAITMPAPAADMRPRPRVAGAPHRVLYLAKESAPYLHNGFCTRSHETLRSLVGAGAEVVAVTMPGFPAIIGVNDAPDQVTVDDITYHHLKPQAAALQSLPVNEYLDIAADALAQCVVTHRPTILHIGSGHRGFETALVGRAVAEWAGLPWIYEVRSFFETTWTDDARYMESAPYFHLRHATESRCMQAADHVVTLSGPMRREIIENHSVPEQRVVGIPNAVDLDRFAPLTRDESMRQQLGLADAFVLGYVSNLSHPREGQEGMIRALPILRRHGVNAKVLLVGDGRRRTEMEELATKLGVRDHVILTGGVPFTDVADYYAQIDLFVVPRINERAGRLVSPMKPYEAMAMQIPLLVSDLPALVEIVDDPVSPRGFTYRAEDPDDLAAVALTCARHPDEMRRRAEHAAAWVAAERTWAANGRAFVEAYEAAEEHHRQRLQVSA